jgi:hypothetical protein
MKLDLKNYVSSDVKFCPIDINYVVKYNYYNILIIFKS